MFEAEYPIYKYTTSVVETIAVDHHTFTMCLWWILSVLLLTDRSQVYYMSYSLE